MHEPVKHDEESESAPSGPGDDAGFAARLKGATLFDLIQFECLERTRRIVRVRSGARVGYLYFRDGNVVHAREGLHVGEAAVRVILRWAGGVFETWDGPWPALETISVSSAQLLLEAAQAADEGSGARKVISFPAKEAAEPVEEEVTRRTAMPGLRAEEPAVVRISEGAVTFDGPAASTGLADVVAYAAQITDLVGDLLGIGPFTSMQFSLTGGTCVIERTAGGELVAAKGGRNVDTAALRRAAGLSDAEGPR